MANMIKSNDYGSAAKQIMIADSVMVSLPIKIANTGVSTVNGRKIVKAGTPIKGDFKVRNTAFAVEDTTPNAILLHDVDVTAGTENGVAVMFGVVDLEKVEASVAEKLVAAESSLAGKVFLMTGSGKAIS